MADSKRGVPRDSDSHIIRLAIESATGARKDASEAWRELIKHQDFRNFASDISRITPAIYFNIGNDSNLPEIARLRGVGKRTWSKNQQLIGAISPVLADLRNINYRLLKGAALILQANNFSLRSMGDVDLLISKKDIPVVNKALLSHGFQNEFDNFCSHYPMYSDSPELTFVNGNGVQIDVHIKENHRATELFEMMLDDVPRYVDYRGHLLKIPPPELMLIHTIQHGVMNVAPGDSLQTIVDSHWLGESIELPIFHKILEESVNNKQIGKFIKENVSKSFRVDSIRDNQSGLNIVGIRKIKKLGRLFGKIWPTLRYRGLKTNVAWRASHGSGPKRLLYFVWLRLGKPRFVEVLVCRLFNGFYADTFRAYSPFSTLSQEIRFKSGVRSEEIDANIEFLGEPLVNTSFLLFKDGILETRIGGKGQSRCIETIGLKGKPSEFSLRLSRASCLSCASKYGEIEIRQKDIRINA